ncbi:MAG: DedA family protein [Clostridiaceae bacterium]
MNELMLDIMSKYGYLGIFFLIFIENLFPPIPSEVILLFGGFLTTYAGLNVPFVILAATLGSLLGAIVLYTLGNKLKYDTIVGLFSGKTGKVLGLKGTDLHKTNEWFRKRGPAAVFLCRFVPLIRSLISIPAGITGMRKRTFLILTALGSAIWNTVLIMLGRIAGESWNKYDSFFSTYSKVFVIIAGVAGLIFIIYRKASAKKNASNINSTGEEN